MGDDGTVLMAAEVGADVPEWIQIARVGVWHGHPSGTERITPEGLNSALAYFERHYAAHGKDLVIDYHHASSLVQVVGGKAPAAGWITEMELRAGETELWGRVQWTTLAANAIGEREYRYLSPVLRFGARDRVTGEPVPMAIRSVALTNTPFLTELEALNEQGTQAAPDEGAVARLDSEREEIQMGLLRTLAEAAGRTVAALAGLLGIEEDAGDDAVAGAILALAESGGSEQGAEGADEGVGGEAAQPEETEAPEVPEEVANALGLETDASPTDAAAAVLGLKAGVCNALGLEPGASSAEVLNAIGTLQADHAQGAAERAVANAIEAGKVQPSQRDFWLQVVRDQGDAAVQALNALPVLTAGGIERKAEAGMGSAALSDAELTVCRQLGLEPGEFAAQRGC